jgi:hypothetical protein
MCAQARRRFTQAIHMVVHSNLFSCLVGRCWPRRRLVAVPVPRPDPGRRQADRQHLPGAPGKLAVRSSITTRGFALARVITAPRPPGFLAVRSGRADAAPATARHPVLRASAPRSCTSCCRAAAPTLTASGCGAPLRGSRPCSVVTQIIAAASGVPTLAKTFLPGRIRQGPSMYEIEGPCPASPRPGRQLAGSAGAARRPRCQVPVRGAGLPAPPTFPRLPPRGTRFPR